MNSLLCEQKKTGYVFLLESTITREKQLLERFGLAD